MGNCSNPDWMERQVEFWNERAKGSSGTGVVPFRALEYAFVARWIYGTRILDAGCGIGEVMAHLKLEYDDLVLAGFDLAEEMVKRAKEKHQNVWQMNMLSIGLQDRAFDTVIAVRSLKNLLDQTAQAVALKELTRVAAQRVIVVDSIKESGVEPPKFNLYPSRAWLLQSFSHEGFRLLREEYFRLPLLRFPIIASASSPRLGSDEGFFVFDRSQGNQFQAASWKFDEITLSLKSLVKAVSAGLR